MKFPLDSFYGWFRNTLRNPKYRWWIIGGSLVYLFSPIDIAPDFIPVIGQLDDITILGLLIAEVTQLLGDYLKHRNPEANNEVTTGSTAPQSPTTIEVEAEDIKEASTVR
jgi:uncharacterized membrane protein YkvA (DUF1232 family)